MHKLTTITGVQHSSKRLQWSVDSLLTFLRNIPLYYEHLYITDTSILRTPIHYGYLYLTNTSISRKPLYYGHLYITDTFFSILRALLRHGHLFISDTSVSRKPLYYGHFRIREKRLSLWVAIEPWSIDILKIHCHNLEKRKKSQNKFRKKSFFLFSHYSFNQCMWAHGLPTRSQLDLMLVMNVCIATLTSPQWFFISVC